MEKVDKGDQITWETGKSGGHGRKMKRKPVKETFKKKSFPQSSGKLEHL